MPTFSLIIPKSVARYIEGIPLPWIGRVAEALDLLLVYPQLGEVIETKSIQVRRVSVWPYKIIYRLDESSKKIIIITI
jgi:plasmid stabilization system protein ParE